MLNTEPWAAGLAGLKQELERLQAGDGPDAGDQRDAR
jgi:hypothetical protein